MLTWQRRTLIIVVMLSCIGCDQVTKDLAKENLPGRGLISLASDTIQLFYAENPGVAFSFGATLPPAVRFWIFSVAVGLFLAGLLAFALMSPTSSRLELIGYGLVIGGGISNVMDRFMHDGHVIDFMILQLGDLRTAIFNLADVVILVGLGLLILSSWTQRHIHRQAALDAAAAKATAATDQPPAPEAGAEDQPHRPLPPQP